MFQVENRGPTKKSPGQQEAFSPTPIDDVVVLISSVCGDRARVRVGGGWVCLCTGGMDFLIFLIFKTRCTRDEHEYLDSGFDAGSGKKKKRHMSPAMFRTFARNGQNYAALFPAHHGPYCQCPLDADCHVRLVVFFSVDTRNYYMTVPPAAMQSQKPWCANAGECILPIPLFQDREICRGVSGPPITLIGKKNFVHDGLENFNAQCNLLACSKPPVTRSLKKAHIGDHDI